MKVVKILAIVVVTSVVTVLCIRSGQAIVKASAPVETVYQTTTDGGGGGGGGPVGTGNDGVGSGGDGTEVGDPDRPDVGGPGRPVVGDPGRPVVGGDDDDDDEPSGPEMSDPGAPEVGGPGGRAVGNPGRLVANDSRPENATDGAYDAAAAAAEAAEAVEDGGVSAATGRSLYEGRLAVGPSASRSKAPQPTTVVHGKQIPQHRPADGGGGVVYVTDGEDDSVRDEGDGSIRDEDVDDDDDDGGVGGGGRDVNVVLDAGVYHAANRPYYRQLPEHDDYATVDADVSAVAEEDGSTGYRHQSTYGVTYDSGGGGENDGTGWSPAEQPAPGYGPPPAAPRPAYGQPAAMVPYPYPVGYRPQYYGGGRPRPTAPNHDYYQQHQQHHYHRPAPAHHQQQPSLAAVQQNNVYQQQQQQQQHQHNDGPLGHVQAALDKVDWHKVGVLALFKVGLAKLKAFAFLKLLFLMVFKLKLFLIAVFFKFLLLLKLMKFFKLLLLPLALVALLPLVASLFSAPMLVGGLLSVPGRLLDFLFGPVLVPADPGAAAAATTKNGAAAVTGGAGAGAGAGAGGAAVVTTAKAGGGGVFSAAVLSDRGPGDAAAYLTDRRRMQAMELLDPALSAFRKVLDSEKCVERIACRMAVVEKAGILPSWINWMLRRVSKFVPNGKLEMYLKAYDDVNNEINIKSESPGNWATWCLERYDCNTTANFTVNVDAVLSD